MLGLENKANPVLMVLRQVKADAGVGELYVTVPQQSVLCTWNHWLLNIDLNFYHPRTKRKTVWASNSGHLGNICSF